MKINRRGQAKVLTFQERDLLFTEGFPRSRDKTTNAACYYLACRISEAGQLRYGDVFEGNSVREFITLRRCTTKNKQATRSIPTHPKLAAYFTQYRRDSKELLLIRKLLGTWTYHSLLDRSRETHLLPLKHATRDPCQDFLALCEAERKQIYEVGGRKFDLSQKVLLKDTPELQDALLRLGVWGSASYGFLYLCPNNPFLFPGKAGVGWLCSGASQETLKKACRSLLITGASSHSWRRTALTEMYRKGFPLKTIQKISGHRSLASLQLYLEVLPEQLEAAVACLPKLRGFFEQGNIC